LKICANEDWVRLFIALRRACLPDTRITPGLLREWKTKVASSIVVTRKCYIVELAALDALPQYPPDLDKWIIPKDELVLPAAIYSDGTLIIDDGNDRANLNVPGVLHIECAAKWSQERPSQALPGRSRGSTAHSHPEALADCVLPTPLPLPPNHPNIPQRVVVPVRPPLPRDQVQSVDAATDVSDDSEQSMPQNHRAANHTHTAWQNKHFILTVGRALQRSAAPAAGRSLEGPCRPRPLLRIEDFGAQPLW